METQIFSPCKNIIFKKSSKRNQTHSIYYNSIITNLKFQHKPKISSFKNPHIIKIDLLFITQQWPKSLKLLYSIMNLNRTISLPWQARPTKPTFIVHKSAWKKQNVCLFSFFLSFEPPQDAMIGNPKKTLNKNPCTKTPFTWRWQRE